jgi:hypothetical protein
LLLVLGGLLWRRECLSVDFAGAGSLGRAGCVFARFQFLQSSAPAYQHADWISVIRPHGMAVEINLGLF